MTCGVPHLQSRSDYVRIARDGRSWATPGLILQVCRRGVTDRMQDPDVPFRLGITASRRVGRAVERNRVRRRLRAAAALVLPAHAAAGCDYVIIGRAATLRRPFRSLIDDLTGAMRRLKAFRDGAGPPPAGREDR